MSVGDAMSLLADDEDRVRDALRGERRAGARTMSKLKS